MKIERDKFAAQLERLKTAIAQSSDIPAFSHIWFDGKYARAYNGGLGIQVPLETEFELGLPGRPLLGLLQGTNVGEINLKESQGGLIFQIGRSRVNLAALPTESRAWNFPDTLSPKTPSIEITEDFLDGLRRVSFIDAAQKTRVEHQGVTMFPDGDNVCLITTNSRTMAQITVAVKLPKQAARVVLPRPFVKQIVAQCAPGAKLYVLPSCLIALDEGVRLYSNLLDNDAITDLPAIIKRYVDTVSEKIVLPIGLNEAVQRAVLLSSQEKDKDEVMVSLALTEDGFLFEGDFGLGSVSEAFELAKPSEQDLNLALSLREFQDCLKEAEEISLLKGACALFGAKEFACLIAAGTRKRKGTD